jgi:hypothetical protein
LLTASSKNVKTWPGVAASRVNSGVRITSPSPALASKAPNWWLRQSAERLTVSAINSVGANQRLLAYYSNPTFSLPK